MRLALVSLLALAGCQGDGGAVSVRWHIVDLTTGSLINPRDVGRSDGACAQQTTDAMSPLPSWSITSIHLVLADPQSGVERPPPCAASGCVDFQCSQREATTPFSLPLGNYALSLRASSPDSDLVTPAPAVRTIKKAEVVNLDVVEIGIHPVTRTPLDAGPPDDLSVPDGGPVP